MTEQAQPQETQTPQTPAPAAEPAPAPKMSRAAEMLTQLMEKEKAIRETGDKYKDYDQVAKRAEELDSLFNNPKKLLTELQRRGISYDDLTLTAFKERPDPTLPLQEKIAALEAKLSSFETKGEERQREAAMSELRDTVVSFVDSSEDFPLVKAAGWSNAVFDHMLDVQSRTGELLSEEEAAKQVEEHLSGLVDKLATLDVVKSRIQPGTQKTPPRDSVTLGNQDSASAPTRVDASAALTNRDVSMLEAAELLRFVDPDAN